MKAIILAAGQGKRIKNHHNIPKAFIEIPNTKNTLIERNIEILKKYGVKKFVIVTGFKNNYFKRLRSKNIVLKKVNNFKRYNNYYSLLSIKRYIKGKLIILFSDILINEKIIKELIHTKNKDICLVIDKSKKLNDTMRIIIKNNHISDIGSHIDPKYSNGNFIGIAKFNNKGSKILNKNLKNDQRFFKDYYVKALNDKLIKKNVKYIDVKKKFWLEIDSKKDLIKLNSIKINQLK